MKDWKEEIKEEWLKSSGITTIDFIVGAIKKEKLKVINDIIDMFYSSFPKDMENLDTMTENQAYRLVNTFFDNIRKETFKQ